MALAGAVHEARCRWPIADAVRIEAASFAGRPVSWRLFPSYAPLERTAPTAAAAAEDSVAEVSIAIFITVLFSLVFTVIFGGLYVAQRNARSGRGDARGARRLGFAMAGAVVAWWLFGEHTFSFEADFRGASACL